ncbi:proprotein convertase P-domain-containing protein [Streptomyces cinereoruber]|uniref:proprotein convertase P-domain-containing protein n=1 Tax=Streptomyces cinereoruber TaxID=67260 RepID=UPI0036450FF9
MIIQFGDSFASGESGGWKGNSLNSSGSRGGTDMAAYFDGSKWEYDPYRVYENASNGYENLDSWLDECHEALSASIQRIREAHPGDYVNIDNWACSGAKSKNLWPLAAGGEALKGRAPQISRAMGENALEAPQTDLKLVVIGVGGNDVGFGDLIAKCVTAWAKKNIADIAFTPAESQCYDDVWSDNIYNVKNVTSNLSKTIKQLKQGLASKGHPWGSYRVVINGAPMILPSAEGDWSYSEGSMDGRCFIRRHDAEWINEHFVTRLNRAMRSVADEEGVGFMDPSEAFIGHRLCESGTVRGSSASSSSANAEWVRFMDVHLSAESLWAAVKKTGFPFASWPVEDDVADAAMNSQRHLSESMHPNYYGQQAIGLCLRLYYTNTSGSAHVKCTNGGGENGTTEQMRIDALSQTPIYADDPNPDVAIPQTGNMMWRTVSVPAAVTPKQYARVHVDIMHPRKGQLQINLVDPLGFSMSLRSCNSGDTGAFAAGTWTFDIPIPLSTVHPPRDPSGNWSIGIRECDQDSYSGTLRSWKLMLY